MSITITLNTERIASIFLMILTAVIAYFIAQATIIDIAKGFLMSAVDGLTFSALANVVFIISIYVIIMGFALVLSSTVTFRDAKSAEYTLYASIITYVAILVGSGLYAFSIGFVVDQLNWILLPILLLLYLQNPGQFLVLIAVIFIAIDGSLNYLKRG